MVEKGLSRREFLWGVAAGAGVAVEAFLTGCLSRQPQTPPPETPVIPSTKVPISHKETAGVGQEKIFLTPEERERAKVEFVEAYREWKGRYVTSEGTPGSGQLRVRRPEYFGDDTVSEGIGYGMILAVHFGDQETFNGLWAYAQEYLIEDKSLMIWNINASGEPTDIDSATDANIDIAYALMVADFKWGGYQEAAKNMIDNTMEYCVEKGTFVLKPGDSWGGSAVTAPSYFSPAQYRMFREYTGDERWAEVAQTSREIIDAIGQRSSSGLVPEFVTGEGEKISAPNLISELREENDEDLDYYGYNATRACWRQAMAALWLGDEDAIRYLHKVNAFFETNVDPADIGDKYSLEGDMLSSGHVASFVAPVVAASIVSSNPQYRQEVFEELVRLSHESYFSDSLRALTFLLLSGVQKEDLEISG